MTSKGRQAPMVPTGMLPCYLAEAFGELYAEDGLAVFGKGLGYLQLLATFVRFYADVDEGHLAVVQEEEEEEEEEEETKKKKEQRGANNGKKPAASNNNNNNGKKKKKKKRTKPPLVLVLGLRDAERTAVTEILTGWGTPPNMMPTMITNESGQSKDRSALYERGGVFCVTSRILIVDLLSRTLVSNDIDGMLLGRAHTVTEQSTEAFILRIFYSQKQPFGSGFVKAFTDAPDQVTAGFAKVDKLLKALHVRKLYLYPRFRDSIRRALEEPAAAAPDVTELHQSLSPLQKEIQNAIAAAVTSCIRELKSSTKLLDWNDAAMNSTTGSNNGSGKGKKAGHKSNDSGDDDSLILSVENCVTSNFDAAITRQLEHDWHRISPAAKMLVQDLKTLRTLFTCLIHYDAIGFWKFICSIKTLSANSRHPSLWLLTPAADVMFRKAKERVYKIHYPKQQKPAPASNINPPVARLRAVLEENPKWRLLQQVLDEIRTDYDNKKNSASAARGRGPTYALVMVKDDRTLDAVTTYLAEGKERALLLRWLRYLEDYNERSRSVAHVTATGPDGTFCISEESRLLLEEEGRARRILFGSSSSRSSSTRNNRKKRSGSGSDRILDNDHGNDGHVDGVSSRKAKLNEVPARVRKRRRIAAEKGRGQQTHRPDDLERRAVLDDAVEVAEYDLDRMSATMAASAAKVKAPPVAAAANNNNRDEQIIDKHNRNNNKDDQGDEENYNCDDDDDDDDGDKDVETDEEEEMFKVSYPDDELHVIVKSYAAMEGGGGGGEQALMYLQDVQPRYVVLYDPDVAFIRSVEIYASLVDHNCSNNFNSSSSSCGGEAATAQEREQEARRNNRVRVYFLMMQASAEEKNFRHLLEREKNAFERLIHHKMTMPPPVIQNDMGGGTQEMQQAAAQGNGVVGGSYMGGTLPLAYDTRTTTTTTTRRGRGKHDPSKERRDIAVDVREFRSALPFVLHRGGMRLAPVTLTVGDFVLSNAHCVERKSVGDLFGSLNSGRLYSQAQAMCKHYAAPCLLIEFDPCKSFCLQNVGDLGVEIKTRSICSQMSILAMHFPKLRILWSRSPHETLRIFQQLKANHDEVDVERAVEVGRQQADGMDAANLMMNSSNGKDDDDDQEEEEEDELNQVAKDMLLRMPGVNEHCARRIMQECDTLAELAEMSREDLRRVAGPAAGQKLFTFFRNKMGAT